MSLAAGLGPKQEIYSIDESFVELTGIRGDLVQRSFKVRARILQWVGIPCCIGIGQSKTLAKLANHVAKSAERKPGSYPAELAQVCNLAVLAPEALEAVLAATPVNEIWGVGRKITEQLKQGGIHTALDLAKLDPATARGHWSVVLERTVRELRGESCIDLEDSPAPKKEIACTRSFGRQITELDDLREAVTHFASRAAEKLRAQGSVAGQVVCFIRTSPFRSDPQYSRSVSVPLRRPSSDTSVLVTAAVTGLTAIYRPGFKMAKAGVMLLDLQSDTIEQHELDFEGPGKSEMGPANDRTRLMLTLDNLNSRYGRGTVLMASAGLAGDRREWVVVV